ncbi:MAG: bifunctional UDP-N-acetylglucosamine diphosphorylase/glucosamine-1-phosphate N-acetyltransferase GlmU [Gammaproteobacteria bacterium]|nr:bifunctional UDP-N-acetylglucosamine diphosphorylase/glucosamine-1-phosphate N-acetyltransferase GlmU [Gammaproteobacteria bacterium]MDH5735306.1 bifunctional UDP-N-acetylglucosamine diphosphorylase/glucosamine-1-phosphate N-acetyltransferase GlmU [Gammaproteobacteria bacterium]
MALSVIILAAGKGTRMKSALPKVLHPLANKPLVEHVYETAKKLGAEEIVIVYGHGGEQVKAKCYHFDARWVEQKEQLGTGHAVQHGLEAVNLENDVLVLYGDVPLTTTDSLKLLLEDFNNKIALMTVKLDNPFGYGRIIRDKHDKVVAIVEQKDASDEQKLIAEVNSGILAAKGRTLNDLLNRIDNKNVQGEYYLTDIFSLAANDGIEVVTSHPSGAWEVEGVNNRLQLATLERIHQMNIANELMTNGVALADPARLDVRGDVDISNDVFIDVNVVLEGNVKIGKGTTIGPNVVIIDSTIGENVVIKSNCVIESTIIENNVDVGPFARLRPETHLHEKSRVGNFVEIKKSAIGKGSKVNHLSYIGDTEMGADVNIGAGTITCNYDGAYKHKTIIKDKVFVGSDSQLVAPVTIGQGVTIGAGATITKDVEDDALVISRVPQRHINGWKRPQKK